jgi:hypothetical protein
MALRSFTNNTDLIKVVYDYSFNPKTVNPGETITWDDLDFDLNIFGSLSFKGHGTSPPVSGTYLERDLWQNDNYATDGFLGWIYIGGGWKAFLPISL